MNNYSPSNHRRVEHPAGFYTRRPGTVVKVKDCWGGYMLPPGLTAGNEVKIKNFDCGYYTVKRHGRRFKIFMANIVEPIISHFDTANVFGVILSAASRIHASRESTEISGNELIFPSAEEKAAGSEGRRRHHQKFKRTARIGNVGGAARGANG
jgi:hypothetical protein